MTKFNFYDYLTLKDKDNQVLKLTIKNKDGVLYAKKVSQQVVQAYTPISTPISKVDFVIIKDLDQYKKDHELTDNSYELRVEPEDVLTFELLDI